MEKAGAAGEGASRKRRPRETGAAPAPREVRAERLASELQGSVLGCLAPVQEKTFLELLERVADTAFEEASSKRPAPKCESAVHPRD